MGDPPRIQVPFERWSSTTSTVRLPWGGFHSRARLPPWSFCVSQFGVREQSWHVRNESGLGRLGMWVADEGARGEDCESRAPDESSAQT